MAGGYGGGEGAMCAYFGPIASAVPITVGSGGPGGAWGPAGGVNTNGRPGSGPTSFGTLAVAGPGLGGGSYNLNNGGEPLTGTLQWKGSAGNHTTDQWNAGNGGSGLLSSGGTGASYPNQPNSPGFMGGGGGGGYTWNNYQGARGGDGWAVVFGLG
jgi:hypothetical protein